LWFNDAKLVKSISIKNGENSLKLQYLIRQLISQDFIMNKLPFLLVLAIIFVGCNGQVKTQAPEILTNEIAINYASFGDKINDGAVLPKTEMIGKFQSLKPGDTVAVKFTSEVKEVCQSKGCWMRMDMGEEEAMVKFKDYGFFMPKNIAGQEAIVSGLAFVEEVSVDEQRHYAEDAGKTKEEIETITEPKRTLSIVSNGVLIPTEN